MTIIKINAITVPADSGDELAHRFAARAGAVDGQDGFEGFELLQPTDDRTTWLVVTRWRDEKSFQDWVSSKNFAHGHGAPAEGHGAPAHGHGAPADGAAASEASDSAGAPRSKPVGLSAELWSYRPAGGSTGTTAGTVG